MSISLNRETLSVTVNGVTSRVTNQALIDFSEENAGKGRFGVKTNSATTISFADVMYGKDNCMEDDWVFCADRDGQSFKKTYSKLVPLTGTVTEKGEGGLQMRQFALETSLQKQMEMVNISLMRWNLGPILWLFPNRDIRHSQVK